MAEVKNDLTHCSKPGCGGKVHVVKSTPEPRGTVRVRMCYKCANRFETLELEKGFVERALAALREKGQALPSNPLPSEVKTDTPRGVVMSNDRLNPHLTPEQIAEAEAELTNEDMMMESEVTR